MQFQAKIQAVVKIVSQLSRMHIRCLEVDLNGHANLVVGLAPMTVHFQASAPQRLDACTQETLSTAGGHSFQSGRNELLTEPQHHLAYLPIRGPLLRHRAQSSQVASV